MNRTLLFSNDRSSVLEFGDLRGFLFVGAIDLVTKHYDIPLVGSPLRLKEGPLEPIYTPTDHVIQGSGCLIDLPIVDEYHWEVVNFDIHNYQPKLALVPDKAGAPW